MTVTVSSRGQLVIPAHLRKRYHISAHTKLELLDTGGEIVLVPLPKNVFRGSRGVLSGVTSGDVIAERRKNRKGEHAG